MNDLEVRSLSKSWGQTVGVDQVSFDVAEASLTVLLGPSGCGKSTVLRLIAGLETASSGSIVIGGREVSRLDPSRRGVSMVFQSYALFPHLNVRENILFGLKVRKIKKEEQKTRLEKAAAMVGLSDLLDRRPSQLSGGQRQRVALARSIVSRRKICLMDEPLSNLDAKLRAEMREEICALQRRLGLTMIYVTHDQVEAMTMADQVILLDRGKIVQAGSPRDLYDFPEKIFAAKFMGTPPMNLLAYDGRNSPDALVPAWHPEGPKAGFIGIRPEHLRLDAQGLEGEITGKDYLGSETILKVRCMDQMVFVKTGHAGSFCPGDRICLSWDLCHIHCFDPDGQRLPDPHNHKRPTLPAAGSIKRQGEKK